MTIRKSITKNIKYAIAIDAGGTKTKARLTSLITDKAWDLKVGAASLSHNLVLACEQIKAVADRLVVKAGNVNSNECYLVCGAAGAGCDKNVKELSDYLKKDYPNHSIVSDAKTSLLGAGNGQPMLVVSLGTGSVAMRLEENGDEAMFGGWGFIAGDLGSGADMGKQLVSRLLVVVDEIVINNNRSILEPLFKDLLESMALEKINRQYILNWLKNATATNYAAIAPLLFKHKKSQMAKNIIEKVASSIDELIAISQPEKQLPVAIIGGFSKSIKPYLSLVTQSQLVEVKGDALDGAFFLAKKFSNN
jgi:glucosamine kinase